MGTDKPKVGLSPQEKRVIQALQNGLPLVERPFQVLAEKAGLSENDFLASVQRLYKQGCIRRFGATLQHQISGYAANAMIAWRVEEEKVEKIGRIMASFGNITHCYQRRTTAAWSYNLYTMVHGKNEAECYAVANKIAESTGITDYQILFSEKELKRSTFKYFSEVQK